MTSATVPPGTTTASIDPGASLLGRVRGLFLVLVALLVAVEVVELVDATTAWWPQRATAAAGILLAGCLVEAVRRVGWRAPTCDLVAAAIIVMVGSGLGRIGAVLVLLIGLGMLRSLYGRRRSVVAATAALVVAYLAVGVVLDGPMSLLDLHVVVVSLGLGALVWVLRQVAEAVAVHDVAASWDRDLAAAAHDLLTAGTADEVDAVVEAAVPDLDAAALRAAGGLLDVPSAAEALGVPDSSATDVIPSDDGAPDDPLDGVASARRLGTLLRHRLSRLETDARLARSLLHSEARYRHLAEQSRDGIYVRAAGAVTAFPYVNATGRGLLGELDRPGAPGIDLGRVHPEDRSMLVAAFKQGAWVGEPLRFRLLDERPRGEDAARWVEVVETPAAWESGRVTQVQGTVRDVTAEHRQAEALRAALAREQEATARLRSVDEMRATFLAAISHELRTPMAGLVGAAHTLAAGDGRLTPEQAAQLTGVVQRQADRVVGLLDDLVDVERLSSGRMSLDLAPLALRPLAKGVAGGLGADDRIEVTGDDVVVEADRTHVERILHNLLRNALKHTPSTTGVRVHVASHPDGALLAVEDDGPGIPVDQRERLFEPLVHGPAAMLSPSPGVGIGLALVRKFAELHGGRAWVEESATGGARFLVLLADASARATSRANVVVGGGGTATAG